MSQISDNSGCSRKRKPAPRRRKTERRRQCTAAAPDGTCAAQSSCKKRYRELTVQSLLQQHYTDFAARNPVSPEMHHAAMMLQICRTAQMGGHCNSCPQGHYHEIAYNSCRHRCCPQCNWLPRQQWLDGWKTRLLPCPHHHCVFTLPHQLNPLWRYNKAEFSNLLFRSASEALRELLADDKYLGGRVGLLCALHTWKQTLEEHIHLHVLVTAGGLSEQGDWLQAKESCLLPRKVLMIKFRGKFKALLREAVEQGAIKLPPSLTAAGLESTLTKLTAISWNVKILERYDSGYGVASYLAGYLKGGPLGNWRLLKVEGGRVYFRYRLGTQEGGDGKRQGVLSLPIDQFIGRLLEHVPPRRYQTIRGYGLYSSNQHSRIEQARAALGCRKQAGESPVETLSLQQRCQQAGMPDACRCPLCGATLVPHSPFPAGRAPPLEGISLAEVEEAA